MSSVLFFLYEVKQAKITHAIYGLVPYTCSFDRDIFVFGHILTYLYSFVVETQT
ncbi:MAG: hypothetical protein KPI85_02005 [cyanobacterium endosymbiont of Epithemia adnata isolate EadnSB Bon19]